MESGSRSTSPSGIDESVLTCSSRSSRPSSRLSALALSTISERAYQRRTASFHPGSIASLRKIPPTPPGHLGPHHDEDRAPGTIENLMLPYMKS